MYMPLNVNIKKCVVFGGEREEGLQKTEKMAVFADELVIVPETKSSPENIVLEQGPLKRVPEALALEEKRTIPVAEEPASSSNIKSYIEGSTFVTSDLDDSELNEMIYRQCQELNILCNIIDVKDLCDTWFMSIIDEPNMLAGLSSKGGCAFYSQRTRIELESQFQQRSEVSRIFTKIRDRLRNEQCNLCTLSVVYENDDMSNFLKNQEWKKALELGKSLARDVPDSFHVQDHSVSKPAS